MKDPRPPRERRVADSPLALKKETDTKASIYE